MNAYKYACSGFMTMRLQQQAVQHDGRDGNTDSARARECIRDDGSGARNEGQRHVYTVTKHNCEGRNGTGSCQSRNVRACKAWRGCMAQTSTRAAATRRSGCKGRNGRACQNGCEDRNVTTLAKTATSVSPQRQLLQMTIARARWHNGCEGQCLRRC